MSDIFTVEDSISGRVASALTLKLTGEERQLLTKRYTENAEAYQLYVKGRYFWNQRTEAGIKKAIEYFQQAIAKDPAYALAYSGLADGYTLRRLEQAPRDVMPSAEEAAIKALAIDDKIAEAHSTLANIRFRYDLDWLGAENEFKRALELSPNNADAHRRYALYLLCLGRFAEAMAEIKRAQEFDPVSIVISSQMGQVFYLAHQYDQAIEQYKKTLEMDPNFTQAQREVGLAYEQKGMYQEALKELQKALNLPGNYFKPTSKADIGHLYAISGKRSEAQKVLEELLKDSQQSYVSPYDIAIILAGLGEKEGALEWLERADEDRSFWLIWLKVDPRLNGLHSDLRFQNLLKSVGLSS
jgi:tetratricopeptide (TPR) repeat protein